MPDLDFVVDLNANTIKEENFDTSKEEQNEPAREHSLVLLNCDYVEFGCVIECLAKTLGLGEEGAMMLAQTAHKAGQATIGTWSKDIAETKAEIAFKKLCDLHGSKDLGDPSAIFDVVAA